MKSAFSITYKVSKTFKAPLDFVFTWCTDFQEDDLKMIGSKNRRNIVEKTKRRVIWTVEGKKLPTQTDPVRVVWLRPPNSWHLEGCGDVSETGEYRLTTAGKSKTRLDMTFTETYSERSKVPSKKELEAEARDHWVHYGKHLEEDYRASVSK